MKIKVLLTFVIAFVLMSCNKTSFNVNVDLQNADGKMVYLYKFVNGKSEPIDSTLLQNNVANFEVENSNVTTYYMLKVENQRNTFGFFSENTDVKIVGDIEDYADVAITASDAQQLVNEYNAENDRFYDEVMELRKRYELAAQNNDEDAIMQINHEYDEIEKNQSDYISNFITENSNSFVVPFILYYNRYNYELNELEDFVANFNIKEESEFSTMLNDYISKLQRVDIGQQYLDFTQETPEGELLSLSGLIGKYKLLLIDFWASWCGPCRAENPNVVAVYNEYHDKGFDILGVSLDSQKENWIKAIEKDGLVWHNVSDLKDWSNEAAQLYAVSSIPSNVLLDENGVIIAKNLRGEDLRAKVEEILK